MADDSSAPPRDPALRSAHQEAVVVEADPSGYIRMRPRPDYDTGSPWVAGRGSTGQDGFDVQVILSRFGTHRGPRPSQVA